MTENDLVWCKLKRTNQQLRYCSACIFRDNCQYRNNGAMRRVKIDWDKVKIK